MRTAVLLGCLLFLCNRPAKMNAVVHAGARQNTVTNKQPGKVGEIPTPAGAKRIMITNNTFANWLRNLPLRKDNRIFLYDHTPKPDQSHHYAVIDISTGNKDLQQCADAIMRIRAEYFYSGDKYDSICFSSGKTKMNFGEYRRGYRYFLSGNELSARLIPTSKCENRKCFMQYLETVFAFSGTYNLFDQLKSRPMSDMQIGDVFIKAGSPGHAMIVTDMAMDTLNGKKYFMLAQGFMPAQDIHIVINPANKKSPWYELDEKSPVVTPGWIFTTSQLRCW